MGPTKRYRRRHLPDEPDAKIGGWNLFRLLHKIRTNRKEMFAKLKKTELWVTILASALLTLLTQLDIEAELAGKIVTGITGLAMTYIGSRGIAKFGNDDT